MASSNRKRIDKGLEQTRLGLVPFVERELQQHLGPQCEASIEAGFRRLECTMTGVVARDTYPLFKVMWDQWNTVFRNSPGELHEQPGSLWNTLPADNLGQGTATSVKLESERRHRNHPNPPRRTG